MLKKLITLLLGVCIIACDQLSKAEFYTVEVFKNALGAFSVPLHSVVLDGIALFILLLLILILWRYQKNAYLVLGGAMLVSGGLSNLFDRIRLGYIPDIFQWHQLFFNVADICILVGFVICVISLLAPRTEKAISEVGT